MMVGIAAKVAKAAMLIKVIVPQVLKPEAMASLCWVETGWVLMDKLLVWMRADSLRAG
jgi:hypothetical protein